MAWLDNENPGWVLRIVEAFGSGTFAPTALPPGNGLSPVSLASGRSALGEQFLAYAGIVFRRIGAGQWTDDRNFGAWVFSLNANATGTAAVVTQDRRAAFFTEASGWSSTAQIPVQASSADLVGPCFVDAAGVAYQRLIVDDATTFVARGSAATGWSSSPAPLNGDLSVDDQGNQLIARVTRSTIGPPLDLFVCERADGGTWTAPLQVASFASPAPVGTLPVAAVSRTPTGEVVVCVVAITDQNGERRWSIDYVIGRGTAWTSVMTAYSFQRRSDLAPSLFAKPIRARHFEGLLLIQSSATENGGMERELVLVRWTGAGWQAPVLVSSEVTDGIDFDASCEDGATLVAWRATRGTESGVMAMRFP